MTKNSDTYKMMRGVNTFGSHKAYISEALQLALSLNIDFSFADEFLIMANPDATNIEFGPAFTPSPGNGINVNGKTFENGVTSGTDLNYWMSGLWLVHELSHTLGLVDLYAFSGTLNGFVGEWSIMGVINGCGKEYLGWERWLLGWISDSQVKCITTTGNNSIQLSPIEVADDVYAKLAVVPIDRTSAVVVESRRSINYDNITQPGVLIYLVDSSISTGNGPIKVLPINLSDTNKLGNTLMVNASFSYQNVMINYINSDVNYDTVSIYLT